MKAEEGKKPKRPTPPAVPGLPTMVSAERGGRQSAVRQQLLPSDAGRGAGSGSRKGSGEGASRAETLPTSRPPCPEEEAVAMVGAPRGNAPHPSAPPGSVRMRLSACTGVGGSSPPPLPHLADGGRLPSHRGSCRLIDGQSPAGRPMATCFPRGGAGLPALRCAAEALRGEPWGREGKALGVGEQKRGLGVLGGRRTRPSSPRGAGGQLRGQLQGSHGAGPSRKGSLGRRRPEEMARRKCRTLLSVFFFFLLFFSYLVWCDLSQALLIGPGRPRSLPAAGNPAPRCPAPAPAPRGARPPVSQVAQTTSGLSPAQS